LSTGIKKLLELPRSAVEAGELGRNDHVDEPGPHISHQPWELKTVGSALVAGADAVVGIHVDELPSLRRNEVAAVALLLLDVGLLAFAVLAQSAVDRRSHATSSKVAPPCPGR